MKHEGPAPPREFGDMRERDLTPTARSGVNYNILFIAVGVIAALVIVSIVFYGLNA